MADILKTFEAWHELGFRVCKGAKHVGRNAQDIPLFSAMQVWRPSKGFAGSEYEEDDEDDEDYHDFEPSMDPW